MSVNFSGTCSRESLSTVTNADFGASPSCWTVSSSWEASPRTFGVRPQNEVCDSPQPPLVSLIGDAAGTERDLVDRSQHRAGPLILGRLTRTAPNASVGKLRPPERSGRLRARLQGKTYKLGSFPTSRCWNFSGAKSACAAAQIWPFVCGRIGLGLDRESTLYFNPRHQKIRRRPDPQAWSEKNWI